MKELHVFDFDGTITVRDSMLAFFYSSHSRWEIWATFLLYSPLLVLMKMRLFDNGKAKQLLINRLYRGWSIFNLELSATILTERNKDIIRPKALEYIQKLLEEGRQVVIVTASIDLYVREICTTLLGDTDHKITIIGTQLEIKDGIATGCLASPNCYGCEKVRRIKALYPNREAYKVIAYGDSRGDKELFEYADEIHFRPFKR